MGSRPAACRPQDLERGKVSPSTDLPSAQHPGPGDPLPQDYSPAMGGYRGVVVDEGRLALMLARDELHQLVTAYCRAVDRADYDTLRNLYHPEATDSHGSFSTGGVEQFIAQLVAAEPYVRVSQHNITTTNFDVEGDTARGEIYCLVFHTF